MTCSELSSASFPLHAPNRKPRPPITDHRPHRWALMLVLVVAILLFLTVLMAGASGWTFIAATSLLLTLLILFRQLRPPWR